MQFLVALICLAYSVTSEIIVHPRDTEAVIERVTYLNCSTSSNGIIWYHYPVGSQQSNYIYIFENIQQRYSSRFRVERKPNQGAFNLVIESVKSEDAGKYICQEDDEGGDYGSAELIVLDKAADCKTNMKDGGIIGANSCDIEPENLKLSCSVGFDGNIPPMIEWRKYGDKGLISQGVQQESLSNVVASILMMASNESIDKCSFECLSARSTTTRSLCVSESIKVFCWSNVRLGIKLGIIISILIIISAIFCIVARFRKTEPEQVDYQEDRALLCLDYCNK